MPDGSSAAVVLVRAVLSILNVTLWGQLPAGASGEEKADDLMISSGQKTAAARPPFPHPQVLVFSRPQPTDS